MKLQTYLTYPYKTLFRFFFKCFDSYILRRLHSFYSILWLSVVGFNS